MYAEQLIALFHEEEPLILKDRVEALPRMDFRLWHYGWPSKVDEEQREILVRALGGWLGRFLVYFLGGRWVPRKKVEEAALIVGARAWLPFLRVRHALQGSESAAGLLLLPVFPRGPAAERAISQGLTPKPREPGE